MQNYLNICAILYFFQSLNVKLNGNSSYFDYFIRTERPIEEWTDGAV